MLVSHTHKHTWSDWSEEERETRFINVMKSENTPAPEYRLFRPCGTSVKMWPEAQSGKRVYVEEPATAAAADTKETKLNGVVGNGKPSVNTNSNSSRP